MSFRRSRRRSRSSRRPSGTDPRGRQKGQESFEESTPDPFFCLTLFSARGLLLLALLIAGCSKGKVAQVGSTDTDSTHVRVSRYSRTSPTEKFIDFPTRAELPPPKKEEIRKDEAQLAVVAYLGRENSFQAAQLLFIP
ncbi:MAG: hypothetical protein K2R98_16275 [Gemmataceae bacterium]|nr:hypothetical protein [Gemmataceae bacterium]